ncbi:AAA family ATPase [Rhodococcus pyridinivorans]|uniref:AAA family ATPase n=1 Tax=Rhodococcus pyridinivorans TaxID=103816 RepID=UPI00200A772B|nr:AAA family ATPase [Rhodococcus pyridinivorans]UPW02868.1 AAA family ATPase [Rhodococcus pyridinivorans]
MKALDRLRDRWRDQGLVWKDGPADTASAQAPGHSPADRSVTFRQIADQVLMNSHADDKQAVLDAVGLTMRDLFDDTAGTSYTYRDGRTVHRTYDDTGRKKFRQAGNTSGRDLYRVERLDQLATGTPVYVVEGEKDVHAVESIGGVAVCSAMGAGKAHLFDWSPLTGHTVVIVADDDDPGRRHAMQVHELIEPIAAGVAVATARAGKDAADHIAAGYGLDELEIVDLGGNTGRRLKVTRGSEVKMQRVTWVMEDWIPAGSLTLLAGREGLGKSTLAAQICAQITRGQLEGELHGVPRNVLYVHSEDSREITVAPRLKAAGADMSRVLFVDVETSHTDSGTLILPLDTLALEKVIAQNQVAFMVLDAATSSMSSELSGKDDRAVRQYLEPLAQLASRQGCVVFGLCHFGKRDGADTGKLILGSIAWSQVARSVLSVAKDEETGNLVVTNTKGNLAPRVRSMEATITTTTITTEDGDTEVGALHWLGETTRDARELLAEPDGTDREDRNEAQAWLEDYLTEHGRTAAKTVKADGRKQGLSDATIKRAAKSLGVVYEMAGFPRTSMWSLPTQSDQSGQPSLTHEPTEPTEPTGADQRKRRELTGGETQWAHTPVNEPTTDPTAVVRCPECGFPLDGAALGKAIHPDCERRMTQRQARFELDGGDAA